MKAHFLPQCYLKGFVDPASEKPNCEPYVWVRDPADASWKNRAPRKVAKLPDYYAIRRPDGSKDQAWEDLLARHENVVAPILRRIPDDDRLSQQEIVALVTFAGTMYLRLPVVHEAAEKIFVLPKVRAELQKNWDGFRDSPDELRRSLEECASDIGDPSILTLQLNDLDPSRSHLSVNRQILIDQVFRDGTPLIEVLMEMRWRLLRPVEPKFFITSDRPVFFSDPRAPEAHRHDLQSAGTMFSLPLTKEVLLLGDWGGPPGMEWGEITTPGVRKVNIQRTGPGLAIYASSPDFLGHSDLLKLERAHAQAPR